MTTPTVAPELLILRDAWRTAQARLDARETEDSTDASRARVALESAARRSLEAELAPAWLAFRTSLPSVAGIADRRRELEGELGVTLADQLVTNVADHLSRIHDLLTAAGVPRA